VKKLVRPELVPPSQGQRHKRFRLSIVGADEDMPRLVRAYGRACQGEFGLVLRPPEQRGVLVLVTKKDGAFEWRSGDSTASRLERANAEVLREDTVRLRVLDGDYADSHFAPYEDVPATYKHGDWVEIVFAPDDQFAHLAERAKGGRGVDSPQTPRASVTAAAAVAAVKDAQKRPPKVGPVTLRGRWTGYLYCEGGQPRVELKRRLATYGTLWVFSNGSDGWAWTFERASKWFGGSGETFGQGLPTLQGAVHIAVLGAMTLVKDACSFRDTHRRAAHDEDYAEKYPIKKREPKRNPTERLREPVPKKTRTRKAKPKAAQPPVAAKPTKPATTRRRSAAPKSPTTPKKTRTRKAPTPKPTAAATGPVDAEKDKALIDAFSRAFAEVLGEGAA